MRVNAEAQLQAKTMLAVWCYIVGSTNWAIASQSNIERHVWMLLSAAARDAGAGAQA